MTHGKKHSLILNMALTARETERIVEITSQAERELSNNLENMFKAFKESKIEEKSTVLNVMQMTQEDMSTEHRTKLEKGHLTGRVETSSFMRLKMIDAESRGETLNTVIDRIESALPKEQQKFTVLDLANASERSTEIPTPETHNVKTGRFNPHH